MTVVPNVLTQLPAAIIPDTIEVAVRFAFGQIVLRCNYHRYVVHKEGVPDFNARLTKLRGLGAKMEAFAKLAAESDDADLKELVATSRDAYRRQMLFFEAAGQLHMEGKLKALPADDKRTHDAARPVGDDGKVKLDAKLIEARESAIVKNAVIGKVNVLVLGGAHDLADNVPNDCQYIRVSTKRVGQPLEFAISLAHGTLCCTIRPIATRISHISQKR